MSWLITGTEKNPVDIYRSNVSLLLHGDGTNGSTAITDSSPSPKTVTVFGNAQISTSIKQFGTGSIVFNGSGDSLTTPSSVMDLGTGDFTIEWQQKLAATNVSYSLFKTHTNGGVSVGNGGIQWNPANTSATNCAASATYSTDWENVVIARKAGVVLMYHKGDFKPLNLVNTAPGGALTAALFELGGTPWFAGYSQFNGYIDEFRITVGVARYETGSGANAGKMVFAGTNELALQAKIFPDA